MFVTPTANKKHRVTNPPVKIKFWVSDINSWSLYRILTIASLAGIILSGQVHTIAHKSENYEIVINRLFW